MSVAPVAESSISNSSPKRKSFAVSTIIVMAASALAAVFGFGREIVTAHYYGTHFEVDAFLNASTIPLVLFGIFNGSLVSALVPTLSDYVSVGRDKEARVFGSTVINGMLIIMTLLAVLGWFLAPVLVPIVAQGFSASEQALEVTMVRWLMPGIIATCLSGVFTAILNARHHFTAPALIWVAANLVTLLIVILFHGSLGIFALVIGSVVGLFAQLLVQIPVIIRLELYRFECDLHHPGLEQSWKLFIPVTLGSGVWQLNLAFDRYFASMLPTGSTAGLNYTTKLSYLPILVAASAISTVIFPLIASQFAKSDKLGIRRSISLGLRMVSFIVIPCAAGLTALAYPIVRTLFERGAFGSHATAFCASLIPFACIPLVAISYWLVLTRASYACKAVRLAVRTTIFVVAINVGISAILLRVLGASGLLLANGISMFIGTAVLIRLLWGVTGGFDWKPIVSSLVRVSIAALAMALILDGINASHVIPDQKTFERIIGLCVLLATGAFVYLGIARLLKIEELALVTNMIAQKLKRPSLATEL